MNHDPDSAGVIQMAVASAVAFWGEQGAVVMRTLLIGLVAWGAMAVIDARSAIELIRSKQLDVLQRLEVHDKRLEAGTDDRWRRRDHDAYAAGVSQRIDALEGRIEGQSRVISTLVQQQGQRNVKP
jgi:hypothetical protein